MFIEPFSPFFQDFLVSRRLGETVKKQEAIKVRTHTTDIHEAHNGPKGDFFKPKN